MAKPRVLISTDIGGSDPDDIQSMVHALLYGDKVDLVGLVSTPTAHGGRTSDIYKVIDAYAKDYANLKTWSADYATPDYLKSITKQGSISVAPSQGFASATEGSKQIIAAAKASAEPLWVLAWGALTDVAQALHDDPSIAGRIKLYSLGAWNTQQDVAARDYIYNNFKDLWWIESNTTMRGMYIDDSGAERNSWKMGDAQGHGALGDYFYNARPWGLKMGDTPSFLYLIDNADNNNPSADSWGGAYVKTGHGPNYWTDNKDPSLMNGGYAGSETVQKHQSEIYHDFAVRLDHAKAANTASGGSGSTAPGTGDSGSTGGTGGGSGNPVTAYDDNYKIDPDKSLWFNTKYLTWNDKGADGGLHVTNVELKSDAGATISWNSSDGTVHYIPLKGWQGKDSFDYTVKDADGSSDTATIFVQVGTGSSTGSSSSSSSGSTAPGTGDSGSTGGTGNPVSVGDDYHRIKAGTKDYFAGKYLLMNDKGADGSLHITGMDSTTAQGGRVVWDAAKGSGIYTPKAGFTGQDSVVYSIADKDGSSASGHLHFDVLVA